MPFDVPVIPDATNPLPVPEHLLILAGALRRIQGGWCQGRDASSRFYMSVALTSPSARRYCINGAICAASVALGASEKSKQLAFHYLQRVIQASICVWNDEWWRRKWHVTAAFYLAIETAMREHYANAPVETIAA